MPYYYLNKKPNKNGDFEIHTISCPHGTKRLARRLDLEWHLSSYAALDAAKALFPLLEEQIRRCYFCCNEERDD